MKMEGDEVGNVHLFLDHKHSGILLSRLNELRQKEELCDVTVLVDGTSIKAHRAVLAASSQYFNAMFTSRLSESSQNIVEIKGVDADATKTLVNFAYTAQLLITDANVQNLFLTSDLLQFRSAKNACIDFIGQQIEVSNCLGIRALAERFACADLLEAVDKFVATNFDDVVETEEFQSMPLNLVLEILIKDDIQVTEENDIFHACVKWVQFDLDNRKKHMSELLKAVRMPFISLKCLHEEIAVHPLVRSNLYCQDIIEEAIMCHCECAGIKMRNSYAESLYFIGGETSFMKETKSIERFNHESTEWETVRPLAEARASFAAAVLDGKLYVIGGCRRGRKRNSMECYDPVLNSWTSLANMTKCQGDVRAAVLGGYIYIAGGSSDGNLTCSYVERYSPRSDRWHTVTSMHHKRRRFALAVLDSKIYAVGGFDDQTGDLNNVEHYDQEQNTWTQDSPMNCCRYDFGAVPLSGYLYAVGGANGQKGSLNTVERYIPNINTWTKIAPMKHCRGGVSVTVHCGKIFAINGMNEYMSIVDSVECYDEVSNTWSSVASTKTARFSGAAVVFPPWMPIHSKYHRDSLSVIHS